MTPRARLAIGIATVLSAVACSCASGATALAAQGEAAGKVKYRIDAATYFDPYDRESAWIGSHLALIKAYPPAGDVLLGYGVPVIGYHDIATEGVAPLSEASIQAYVSKVKRDASAGYAGTFLDDINWSVPYRDWSEARSLEPEMQQLAKLVESTRAAIPSGIIEMNSQYHDIYPLYREGNPYVLRALSRINLLCKEFGVGPTSGINTASDFANFLSFTDELRAKGIHITMTSDPSSPTPATMEYNEATYLLINDGHDYINGQRQTPQNWWPGFDVDLGGSTGERASWNGLLRRDFSGGMTLVNPPGSPTRTVTLPSPMRTVAGATVTSVTLAPASGAVLAGSGQSVGPSAPGGAPVATETVVQATLLGSASPAGAPAQGAASAAPPRSGAAPAVSLRARARSCWRHGHHRCATARAHHRARAARYQPLRTHGAAAVTSISGAVTHATGGRVAVKLDVRRQGRWLGAGAMWLRVSAAGRFSSLMRLRQAGVYRVLALYSGTAGYRPSSSGYHLLLMPGR